MELKKLLLGLGVLAIGLLSACSNEEDINGGKEGVDTTFSITVSSANQKTKAIEIPATEKESNINNVVVAVFKMNGSQVGEMVYGPMPIINPESNKEGDKITYTLTGIKGKTGNSRILVIANSPNSNYSACKTWQDFKDVSVEISEENLKNPEVLPKIGWFDGDLVAGKKTYNVELAQLTARMDLKVKVADEGYKFDFNTVIVENINYRTDIILSDANGKFQARTEGNETTFTNVDSENFTFYTFENCFEKKRVRITLIGTLTDPDGGEEEKSYSFALDRDIEHGTYYDITGKLDVSTRLMSFTWTISNWSKTLREVYVDLIKSAFLVVKDLEMVMPNINTITTSFQSSSNITIDPKKIVVTNGTNNFQNKVVTITGSGSEGIITIKSEIPVNFVPKYITFIVKNDDELEQTVSIVQFPPLYVTAQQSMNKADAGDGQTNRNMYVFKTLVSDFRSFNDPDELNENWAAMGLSPSKHYNASLERGKVYSDGIRESAATGFPDLYQKTYSSYNHNKDDGYSTYTAMSRIEGGDGKGKLGNYKYYDETITSSNTVENNMNNNFISPNFVLASQNGTNPASKYYMYRKEFCAGYVETAYQYNEFGKPINEKGEVVSEFSSQHYKITYGQGTWRVPTKMELYLIDVLQNYKKCEVKRILEGSRYWHAGDEEDKGVMLEMMDPRVNPDNLEKYIAAVRCVRDIKNNK